MILQPRLRKILFALHIGVSVSWIGAVLSYLILDITVSTTTELITIRGVWISMNLIVRWIIAPLAIVSLVTGILIALGTPWGLFDHWWVVISLLLTLIATIVLFLQIDRINSYSELALNATVSYQELRSLGSTLVHSIGGLIILVFIFILNTYKPKGLTPHGWYKKQKQLQMDKSTKGSIYGTT